MHTDNIEEIDHFRVVLILWMAGFHVGGSAFATFAILGTTISQAEDRAGGIGTPSQHVWPRLRISSSVRFNVAGQFSSPLRGHASRDVRGQVRCQVPY
jgi:hypothetical protein